MEDDDKAELIKTFGSLEQNRDMLNYFDEYEASLRGNPNVIVSRNPADLF